MRKLQQRHWILLACFLVALIVTGMFAMRAANRASYWREHRDETIRPWMSVRYVARSYRVPPAVLYQAIDLAPIARDRRPLRSIAKQKNESVGNLIADLQQAIVEYRSAHPPPNGPQLRKESSSP